MSDIPTTPSGKTSTGIIGGLIFAVLLMAAVGFAVRSRYSPVEKSMPVLESAAVVPPKLPEPNLPQPEQNADSQTRAETSIDTGKAPFIVNSAEAVAALAKDYKSKRSVAIGSRWTYLVTKPESVGIPAGKATVQVVVDGNGKILSTKVTENTSDAAFASLCERAILESQGDLKPPPAVVLKNGVFEDSFDFILQ